MLTALYTYWQAAVWKYILNVLIQRLLLFLMHREHVQGKTKGVSRCLSRR